MSRLRTTLFALALSGAAVAARADDEPAKEAKADGIAWRKDYEAAKAEAAKQKKGLLVYLTPDWFT